MKKQAYKLEMFKFSLFEDIFRKWSECGKKQTFFRADTIFIEVTIQISNGNDFVFMKILQLYLMND